MKKKIYLIMVALVVALSCSSVKAQDRLFKNIAKMDGVTSVYVGKQMIRLMGDTNIIGGLGNFNASALLSKLTGIEVLSCENAKNAKQVTKTIDGIIKSMDDLEVITEVEDNEDSKDSSHVVIYSRSKPGSDVIKTLLINVQSDNEPTIVALHGDFTIEDIAAAMGSDNGKTDD